MTENVETKEEQIKKMKFTITSKDITIEKIFEWYKNEIRNQQNKNNVAPSEIKSNCQYNWDNYKDVTFLSKVDDIKNAGILVVKVDVAFNMLNNHILSNGDQKGLKDVFEFTTSKNIQEVKVIIFKEIELKEKDEDSKGYKVSKRVIIFSDSDARSYVNPDWIKKTTATEIMIKNVLKSNSNPEIKINSVKQTNVLNGTKKQVRLIKSSEDVRKFEVDPFNSKVDDFVFSYKDDKLTNTYNMGKWVSHNYKCDINDPHAINDVIKQISDNCVDYFMESETDKHIKVIKEKFWFLDNLKNVNEEMAKELELDSKLVRCIVEEDFSAFSLVIDYDTSSGEVKFETKSGPKKLRFELKVGNLEDIELEKIFSSLLAWNVEREKQLSADDLANIFLDLKVTIGSKSHVLKNILRFSLEGNKVDNANNLYVFNEGEWYSMNCDIANSTNERFDLIMKRNLVNFELKEDKYSFLNENFTWIDDITKPEAEINEKLSAYQKDKMGVICLDKKLVKLNGRDKLELADLLFYKENTPSVIFTVKKLTSSQGISHLIEQAKKSRDLLKDGKKIAEYWSGDNVEHQWKKGSDWSKIDEIVLVIIADSFKYEKETKAREMSDLQFFAKASLVNLFKENNYDDVQFKVCWLGDKKC